VAEHELPHPAVGHSVRVHLERGQCPVCPGQELEGVAFGGLEWAHCPCCASDWRVEPDGFSLRPGRIVEEWA
jgi:formate dehydrogenase maturation protein FdhE